MTRNFTYYIDDNHTYMIKSNTLWLKIFYHNTTFGDYFESLGEVYDSHTAQKFSILGAIGPEYLVNEKYEFLLEIPGQKGYNRWRQKIHPLNTTKDATSVTNGYEPVRLSWKNYFDGGLSMAWYGNTYLDCFAGNNTYWWYSIGAKKWYTKKNTMPLIAEYYEGPEIKLWVRVPSLSVDGLIITYCAKNMKRMSMIFSFMVFLVST